jgi:hypothetical protein
MLPVGNDNNIGLTNSGVILRGVEGKSVFEVRKPGVSAQIVTLKRFSPDTVSPNRMQGTE